MILVRIVTERTRKRLRFLCWILIYRLVGLKDLSESTTTQQRTNGEFVSVQRTDKHTTQILDTLLVLLAYPANLTMAPSIMGQVRSHRASRKGFGSRGQRRGSRKKGKTPLERAEEKARALALKAELQATVDYVEGPSTSGQGSKTKKKK